MFIKERRINTLHKKMVSQNNVRGKGMMFIAVCSFVLLISLSYVSAYSWLCLERGDGYTKPNGDVDICDKSSCTYCVDSDGYSTSFGHCGGSPSCDGEGGGSVDSEPPVLTVNSPTNNNVYDSKKVLFDVSSNELIALYYMKNDGKENWKRLSSSTSSYSKTVSLDEGENDITIKGVDENDNEAEIVKTFFVDSKDPKIKKTSPKSGFANGLFEVQFEEDNPTSLVLFYGTDSVTRQVVFNLDTCTTDRRKTTCTQQVNLAEFDGEEIEYWVELEDIAGNTDESKPIGLDVDMTAPVITNPTNFWTMPDEDHIQFNLAITELNFDEAVYIDNSDSKPKEKRICSSLKNGLCTKTVSFKDGHHDLDIIVRDDAGNFVMQNIEFDVLD
ncbi:MAG: hypothetical protein RL557_869 [archaeon]